MVGYGEYSPSAARSGFLIHFLLFHSSFLYFPDIFIDFSLVEILTTYNMVPLAMAVVISCSQIVMVVIEVVLRW